MCKPAFFIKSGVLSTEPGCGNLSKAFFPSTPYKCCVSGCFKFVTRPWLPLPLVVEVTNDCCKGVCSKADTKPTAWERRTSLRRVSWLYTVLDGETETDTCLWDSGCPRKSRVNLCSSSAAPRRAAEAANADNTNEYLIHRLLISLRSWIFLPATPGYSWFASREMAKSRPEGWGWSSSGLPRDACQIQLGWLCSASR